MIDTQNHIATMFSELSFDSQRHLYFWDGQRIPKSVSGLVERHEYPFEENKILKSGLTLIESCARKEGVTVQELKHKWQTTNQTACELGTETHDFLELYTGLESPKTPQQKAGVSYLKSIQGKYRIIGREIRMYSREYNYAGTIDLLLEDIETGELILVDYKTNKDIFKTFGVLKPPFGYLESHPYNKYQLQLSYYQIMLEEIGLKISDRILVYLRADGEFKTYSTVDFTSYLRSYMDNLKN